MPKATSNPADQAAAAAKSAPPPPVSGVECRFCHQWETGVDDAYCSFCGHLLLALEIQPESLILISTLAPAKELTFRNASPKTLQAVLVPKTGPRFPALVFEPGGTLSIAPNEEVKVRVELDAEQLPPDFRERELDYVCLVNNDRRQQFPLKITVRAGPRPKLHTPFLTFGDVPEGAVVDKTLEISNSGGIPLNVREVRLEGSPCLKLKGPFAPALVQPGQRLSLPVLWDSRAATAPAEVEAEAAASVGVRLVFGNYPAALFVPARARSVRYLLQLKPSVIRLPQVLAKQDYAVKVELQNLGTTDVEIASIESDQTAWLDVVGKARTLTLLCAAAGQKTGELSPTTFARTYSFTMVCRPQKLAAGKHQGRITVRPAGQGQEPLILGVEIDVVHPKPYPDYIGIDFGTTNSVVAIFSPNKYQKKGGKGKQTERVKDPLELVKDDTVDSHLIPSILVFENAETYKIGHAAKNDIYRASDSSVRSIKRIMGYDHEREFFGRRFNPEELAARIIRKLVEMAERKLQNDTDSYFDIRKAIITVPANFFDVQIRGVLNACKEAGLDIEEDKVAQAAKVTREALSQAVNAGVILDEPSAAVLYYIHYLSQIPSASEVMKAIDREEGLRLLVFDYGGGTLDVSVANVSRLKTREAGLKILANMGDNGIGGDTIDLILMQELLKRCKEKVTNFNFDTALISIHFKDLATRRERESWSAETWREVLRVRLAWKDLSEAVKIQIAEQEQAETEILPDLIVNVADGKVQTAPRSVKIAIPRTVLEDLLQEVLDKCQRLIKSALKLASLEPEQIDFILHTGRQSLLPLIRQRVREVFPDLAPDRDILDPEQIKICVAKGAALYGWRRDKLVDPEARIQLLSEGRLLPHSYGVEKFSNFLPEFDEVIERGQPYPTDAVKQYGPEMVPPSGFLNLKFYQNTGAHKAILDNPEVNLLGQISINTLADGEPGCAVRFVIDANRKLDVFADGQEVKIQPARLQGEESWMG